jgi:hypothetical protein
MSDSGADAGKAEIDGSHGTIRKVVKSRCNGSLDVSEGLIESGGLDRCASVAKIATAGCAGGARRSVWTNFGFAMEQTPRVEPAAGCLNGCTAGWPRTETPSELCPARSGYELIHERG